MNYIEGNKLQIFHEVYNKFIYKKLYGEPTFSQMRRITKIMEVLWERQEDSEDPNASERPEFDHEVISAIVDEIVSHLDNEFLESIISSRKPKVRVDSDPESISNAILDTLSREKHSESFIIVSPAILAILQSSKAGIFSPSLDSLMADDSIVGELNDIGVYIHISRDSDDHIILVGSLNLDIITIEVNDLRFP